jgi:hypothetical protein
MTEADVQGKIRANARHALNDGRVERVVETASALEKSENIRSLINPCI